MRSFVQVYLAGISLQSTITGTFPLSITVLTSTILKIKYGNSIFLGTYPTTGLQFTSDSHHLFCLLSSYIHYKGDSLPPLAWLVCASASETSKFNARYHKRNSSLSLSIPLSTERILLCTTCASYPDLYLPFPPIFSFFVF